MALYVGQMGANRRLLMPLRFFKRMQSGACQTQYSNQRDLNPDPSDLRYLRPALNPPHLALSPQVGSHSGLRRTRLGVWVY